MFKKGHDKIAWICNNVVQQKYFGVTYNVNAILLPYESMAHTYQSNAIALTLL